MPDKPENFWSLLRDSVIVQSIITVLLVATICYTSIAQIPVSDFLVDLTILVVGFWFGSKVQNLINKVR